jgi:hypothetical protein
MADLTPIMRYGPKFQFGRRLMNTALSTRAVQKWEGGIEDESQAMLRNVLSSPTEFVGHLEKLDFLHSNILYIVLTFQNRMAGSMVMMSMYGHRVTSAKDPYVELAIEFMVASTDAIAGRWLVDFFPIG